MLGKRKRSDGDREYDRCGDEYSMSVATMISGAQLWGEFAGLLLTHTEVSLMKAASLDAKLRRSGCLADVTNDRLCSDMLDGWCRGSRYANVFTVDKLWSILIFGNATASLSAKIMANPALHLACWNGSMRALELLLDCDIVNMNIIDSSGDNIIMYFTSANITQSSTSFEKVVSKRLLDLDLDYRDPRGKTSHDRISSLAHYDSVSIIWHAAMHWLTHVYYPSIKRALANQPQLADAVDTIHNFLLPNALASIK
jgi:hypothetical protein